MPRLLTSVLSCVLAHAIGCGEPAPPQQQPQAAKTKPASVRLTVAVVDDAPLAAGIKLLRGEWAERNGGQLEIKELTVDELLAAKEITTDLIIYPSRLVGGLVERGWLRPVRNSVLQSSDLAMDDVFPLVRNATLRFGGQIFGLTLGDPPLMLASASDAEFDPTWEATRLVPADKMVAIKYPRAAEFLARSVAYSQHRSMSANCFHPDSMQPQISSLPFVRAVEQMLLNAKLATEQQVASLELTWPTAMRDDNQLPRAFRPLPPAAQIYNPLREVWEDNNDQLQVVMIGFAGRTVSVTRATRNSASAFKLLEWMGGKSVATQLSPRSAATVWCRKSQAPQAEKWLAGSGADDSTVGYVNRQLSSDRYWLLPRIPGIDEYLQILDGAILAAVAEDQSAKQVLENVTGQWNTLTDRYDRDRQRVAYRKHLGINDQ